MTEEDYKALSAELDDPNSGLTEAEKADALQEKLDYEDQNLTSKLNPDQPLLPQALATQPASTNPKGDDAAQKEWLSNPVGAAKGTVFVYEPPLTVAKREMMENPAIHQALFPDPDFQPTPEDIAKMDEKSITYQAYADKKWRETADAAAKAGKTAYRYSKSPWLQGGGAMSAIDTLGLKLKGSAKPAGDSITSFINGVDDTAMFGMLRSGNEANKQTEQDVSKAGDAIVAKRYGGARPPPPTEGDELSGGTTTARNMSEANDMANEAHPFANALGQVAGIAPDAVGAVTSHIGLAGLKTWSASNALYDVVASGGKSLADKAGGGLGARLATSAGSAAVGGAAVQGVQEGIDAASNLAQGRDPGTLAEAGERVRDAGMNPLNVGLGVGGEAVGSLAAHGSDWFRNGARYKGAPARFEQTGGTFELGKGPVPPKESAASIAGAKKLDVDPVDVMAHEIAPQVAEGQKKALEEVHRRVGSENEAYHASNEGQMLLPATKTQEKALELLREHHAPEKDGSVKLKPIANPAAVRKVHKLFNSEIQHVSTKPSPGAIEMSVDEAQAFLDPKWKSKLIPKSKKPPTEPGGGTREVELKGGGESPDVEAPARQTQARNITAQQRPKTEAPADVRTAGTIPPKGKAMKPAGAAEAARTPPTADTVHIKEEFARDRNEYGEALAPYRDAQRADNARASKLSDGPGMNPDRHIQPSESGDVEAVFGSAEKGAPYVKALKDAGAPININTLHSLKMGGSTEANARNAASPDFNYTGGSRALGRPIESAASKKPAPKPAMRANMSMAEYEAQGGKVGARLPDEVQAKIDDGTLTSEAQQHAQSLKGEKTPVLGAVESAAAKNRGGRVTLAELRGSLPGSRAEQDAALKQLQRDGKIILMRNDNTRSLTKADHDAALTVGDSPRHLVYLTGGAVLAGSAASASGDKDTAAAGAGIVGLATALKRKGVEKVYVTPRRYNSQQHETLKRTLETLQPDPKGAGAREARELYIASLKDRDARPRGGQPGGWSALQQEHHQQISEAERRAELAAPGGDAFQPLVRYAQQRPGQMPMDEAVRAAADRAGVRQNIERIRNLDPLNTLRNEMRGGAAGTGRAVPQTAYGAASRMGDAAMMRLGYPAMRMLESHTGVRGGRAGKAAMLQREKKEEDK